MNHVNECRTFKLYVCERVIKILLEKRRKLHELQTRNWIKRVINKFNNGILLDLLISTFQLMIFVWLWRLDFRHFFPYELWDRPSTAMTSLLVSYFLIFFNYILDNGLVGIQSSESHSARDIDYWIKFIQSSHKLLIRLNHMQQFGRNLSN